MLAWLIGDGPFAAAGIEVLKERLPSILVIAFPHERLQRAGQHGGDDLMIGVFRFPPIAAFAVPAGGIGIVNPYHASRVDSPPFPDRIVGRINRNKGRFIGGHGILGWRADIGDTQYEDCHGKTCHTQHVPGLMHPLPGPAEEEEGGGNSYQPEDEPGGNGESSPLTGIPRPAGFGYDSDQEPDQ